MIRRGYPMLLLAGGIILIQYHAIAFWNEAVDSATGWAWSIQLELIALWLWYQPRTRLLAFLTTVVVLSGPLYQVTSPLVIDFAHNAAEKTTVNRRATLLREAIATEEVALQTFLANSTDRSGWLPAIKQAQVSLESKRNELRSLLAPAPHKLPWQQLAIMGLQAVALVLLQLSNVLAITTLTKLQRETPVRQRTKRKKPKLDLPPNNANPHPTSTHVKQPQTELTQHHSTDRQNTKVVNANKGIPQAHSHFLPEQEKNEPRKRIPTSNTPEQLSLIPQ